MFPMPGGAKSPEAKKAKLQRVKGRPPLIAIGASTGGVERVRAILENLSAPMPPILVCQHIAAMFVESFSKRLNTLTPLTVKLAEDGEMLKDNHVYVAPSHAHLGVGGKGQYKVRLIDGPPVSGHKASVDVMFESVAEAVGAEAVGIILSGMGADGAKGLKDMYDKGCYTLGENKASCVVYGMPHAAKMNGGVCAEMSLTDITSEILSIAH